MARFPLVVAVAAVCAACAHHDSSRTILYKGTQSAFGKRFVVSDARARVEGRIALAQWRTGLRSRAMLEPRQRFDNLPPRVFLARLRAASRKYHFHVVRVRFYRPKQLAPLVVVRTRDYRELAQAVRDIDDAINPHRGADNTGWSYEGFFLEAQDERGIPFVVVYDLTRGQVEGSQFARSEELYPFAHG
jgi:hypothetical protein